MGKLEQIVKFMGEDLSQRTDFEKMIEIYQECGATSLLKESPNSLKKIASQKFTLDAPKAVYTNQKQQEFALQISMSSTDILKQVDSSGSQGYAQSDKQNQFDMSDHRALLHKLAMIAYAMPVLCSEDGHVDSKEEKDIFTLKDLKTTSESA